MASPLLAIFCTINPRFDPHQIQFTVEQARRPIAYSGNSPKHRMARSIFAWPLRSPSAVAASKIRCAAMHSPWDVKSDTPARSSMQMTFPSNRVRLTSRLVCHAGFANALSATNARCRRSGRLFTWIASKEEPCHIRLAEICLTFEKVWHHKCCHIWRRRRTSAVRPARRCVWRSCHRSHAASLMLWRYRRLWNFCAPPCLKRAGPLVMSSIQAGEQKKNALPPRARHNSSISSAR